MWSYGTSVVYVWPGFVLVAWTVTSFLCHECGKYFLTGAEIIVRQAAADSVSSLYIVSALMLTIVQCITCLVTLRISWLEDRRQMALVVVTHVMSTLATNYSMACIEASSVFAVKLLEPVTMAIAHYVFIERVMNIETVLSIPVIIAGTFIFTDTSKIESKHLVGVVIAFTSNILITTRNIALKLTKFKDTIELKKPIYVTALIAMETVINGAVSWINLNGILPVPLTFLSSALFASGICHAIYNYISLCLVLKVMNVVSHSIANIFKRLIVVLLLYSWGQRKATWFNFFGLLMASLGLAIYVFGKVRKQKTSAIADIESAILRIISRFQYKKMIMSSLVFFCTLSLCVKLTTITTERTDVMKGDNHWLLEKFVSQRLVDLPLETNLRALTMRTTEHFINEAQRVLINLMTDIIGTANHVMLMEIATYENKGDPAIAAGEVMLLRKMNKKIVYYCSTFKCKNKEEITKALNISQQYNISDLVILMQGGGNLVGYPYMDTVRETILNQFPNHKTILFSQSIWLFPDSNKSLENCQKIYSNRSNLYMFIRDKQSLQIAQNNFKGVKIILAPDMAFGLGHVPRSMPPYYDIVWLRRSDTESSRYILPEFPKNISVLVSDWLDWKTNEGRRDMETSFIIAESGLSFLQRGRIVVTDRLHGHILSILMDTPHVLIDNPPYFKLSSFDKTWTSGLENTKLVNTGQEALNEALLMLQKYNATLPVVGPIDMNAFS
ncbi:uncharacterized protein LOC131952989 [Physella acuta]|uniref:uncharacterized protein LOC131952989 n=1 Tax=Physella acuta TaxID=109671 RepID=UPI0027DE1FD3|nr:uncharacterized protein LOC131952989 [Physella acuta]